MKLTSRSLILVVAGMAGISALAARAQAQTARPQVDKLQLFRERSIFSRERLRYSRAGFGSQRDFRVEPRRPAPVFTGVMEDGLEYVAYLESPDTGAVISARVGQVLPQGKIEAITLDYLLIRSSDAAPASKIQIGQTLTGTFRAPPGTVDTAATTSTAPSTQIAADSSTATTEPMATTGPAPVVDLSDPIEKMKARRRAELQGK
jgi:hypothetical protein